MVKLSFLPDIHCNLLKMVSQTPMNTIIELYGQVDQETWCSMTYMWLKIFVSFCCLPVTLSVSITGSVYFQYNVESRWAKIESIPNSLTAASHRSMNSCHKCRYFYFNLTCDVIGDFEVNKIRICSTNLAELTNAVWILRIRPVVS